MVFISGYGRDETIARALERGAEDYIVKPFSGTELAARVGAVLRRRAQPGVFVLGELAIHYEERRVTVGERQVALTEIEYELLRLLSLNAGRVTTYETLQRHIWSGRAAAGDSARARRQRGAGRPGMNAALATVCRDLSSRHPLLSADKKSAASRIVYGKSTPLEL